MTSVLSSLRSSAGGLVRPPTTWCLLVGLFVYSAESGGRLLPQPLRSHLDGCLRCQAEMARERQLIRGLAAMAGEVEVAPTSLGLIEYGASQIGDNAALPRKRWVLGATLASVSAGTVGVVVLVGRRLRTAPI